MNLVNVSKESLYRLILVFITITFGNTLFLYGQKTSLYFHNLTVEDNLTSQSLNYFLYKDEEGFVWISSSEGLNLFNGREIRQYVSNKKDTSSLINGNILSAFHEDKNQNIWFSTVDGLEVYDRRKDNFQHLSIKQNHVNLEGSYYLLYVDPENDDLWVRIQNSLYVLPKKQFDKPIFITKCHMNIWSTLVKKKNSSDYLFLTPLDKGLEYRKFRDLLEIEKKDTILSDFNIRNTYSNEQVNDIWFGTDNGLLSFDPNTGLYQLYNQFGDKRIEKIKTITQIDKEHLLVGTQNQGIFYFDLITHKFTDQIYQFNGTETKPFVQSIDEVYLDRDQILWVSTSGRGIFYAQLKNKEFGAFLQNREGDAVETSFIRSIIEDNNGSIYCLTQNGVFEINKEEELTGNTILSQSRYLQYPSSYPYSIFCDADNSIWVADLSGLYYLPNDESQFEKVNLKNIPPNSPIGFFFLKQLGNGEIITTTSKGIFQWNVKEKLLERIAGLDIAETGNSFSWISQNLKTSQIIFRKIENSFLIGHFEQGSFRLDTTILFKPFVNYLYQDSISDKHWLATSEGLYWIEWDGNSYEILKDTVLGDKILMGVLRESNSSNLWLSSNRGLIKYNFQSGSQQQYGLVGGLQAQEFNFFASYKTKSDKLIFGGVNGFNIFDPKAIKDNLKRANPTITSILINDVKPKQKLKCSKTDALNTSLIQKLDFTHEENTLSFRFAALDYVDPEANQFKYRMLGIEKDWVPPKTENFARYPNLPPGDYTFEVDATNSDGIWSGDPTQLTITIHPAWYQTTLAYSSFGLILVLFIFAFYRYQLNHRLAEAEAYRLKELDKIKTALYTNITHEFRTPLMIIMGMAEQIQEKPKEWQQKGLQMIHRSGQNLLNLVNQMLDLAKIEVGGMQPKYIQGNIISYLQYLVESFQTYAASKNINLIFYSEIEDIMMDYDTDKLKTILTNLLSNAVKFTPEQGEIIVHANLITKPETGKKTAKKEISFCQIKIKDNGIGIASEKLLHVFDRFYQVEDAANYSGGTGVGLALTKELVELMDGRITVNSQLKRGSEFIILLPFRQLGPLLKDKESLPISMPTINTLEFGREDVLERKEKNETLPLLLLIEDNLDVITYLQACLIDRYRIIIALNGQSGIGKALEQTPDLIISDVMMPEKDGFEVCSILKQNERSSHIPIIILTAKTHIDDKLKGLSLGADAYLSKPFHQKELEVRIAQLLLQRKRLQEYFSAQTIAQSNAKVPNPIAASIEDAFLQKVIKAVEDNIAVDMELEQFCQLLMMSRSQVYRKIKALTGYSTTIFIRRIRLKHAYHLLSTTNSTISEVAYQVGFKDPFFFSRNFSEVFGKSPSEVKGG